jgi:VanZ family protein
VKPHDPRGRRRAYLAWAMVILCALFILGLGGAEFGAAQTSRYLLRTLRWLFPDLTISTYLKLIVWIRKTAHFTEYALLGALAFRAVFLSTDSALLRVALLAVGVAATVAATDEFRQAFLPTRTGSAWDVALDVTGALIAIALAYYLKRRAEQGMRRAEPA